MERPVSSIQRLISIIAASSLSSFPAKSIVVEIEILGNRIIKGMVTSSVYKGSERLDVILTGTSRIDSDLLQPCVKKLLKEGKSFVIGNEEISHSSFEWTIEEL